MREQFVKQRQRGSIIVEFALVFPLMLGIVGFIISFSFALWANFQLFSFATAAARVCAYNGPAPNPPQDMASCAISKTQEYIQDVAAVSTWYATPHVTSNVFASPVDPDTYILVVDIVSQMTWLQWIDGVNILPGGKSVGGDKLNIHVQATQAFRLHH